MHVYLWQMFPITLLAFIDLCIYSQTSPKQPPKMSSRGSHLQEVILEVGLTWELLVIGELVTEGGGCLQDRFDCTSYMQKVSQSK